MFVEFFGFKENPFSLSADFSFFKLDSTKQSIAKQVLLDIATNRELVTITGPSGVGKTLFLRYLSSILPSSMGRICLSVYGANYFERTRFIMERLAENNRLGKQSLVVVDNAHELEDDDLNLLLSLNAANHKDHPAFTILLCGLDTILAKLERKDFKTSVASHPVYTLPALNELEVKQYIDFRLLRAGYDCNQQDAVFSANAVTLIAEYSQGIPHSINLICGASLLMASLDDQTKVTEQYVLEALPNCLLSNENLLASRMLESVQPNSQRTCVLPFNRIQRNRFFRNNHLKPLSSRLSQAAYRLPKVTSNSKKTDHTIAGLPVEMALKLDNCALQRKFEVEALSGLAICLSILVCFLAVKTDYFAEDKTRNIATAFHVHADDNEKIATVSEVQAVEISDQPSLIGRGTQEQRIWPFPVETVRAELAEAQHAFRRTESERNVKLQEVGSIKSINQSGRSTVNQVLLVHGKSAESKTDRKKITISTLAAKTETKIGSLQTGNRVAGTQNVELITSDSNVGQKIKFKHASHPLTEIKKQPADSAALKFIAARNSSQTSLFIDEQEADVRNRSSSRLQLEKLGIDFSVESLLQACQAGNLQAVSLLLSAGIPAGVKDLRTGLTPLFEAAKYGRLQVVKTLLDKGAYADSKNYEGLTPLMIAIKNGNVPVIQTLLDSRAKPLAKDFKG